MKTPSIVLSHAGVQYSYQLAHALQEEGLLSEFWTSIYCPNPEKSFFPKIHSRRRYYEGLRNDFIRMCPWPELLERVAASLLNKNSYYRNQLLHWRNRLFDGHVAFRLGRNNFDIFIGLSGSSLSSIQKAKKLGKIAVVDQHDIHFSLAEKLIREEREMHPEFSSSMPYWPPLKKYLDCVGKELALADYIFVPSGFAFKSHLEAGINPGKLILLHHGCNLSREAGVRRRKKGSKLNLLFVGQMTQRKGIKYLLEAVKQLNHPDIELTMIGDMMCNSEALRPYQGYFKYFSYVPFEKLNHYFLQADALVLPSVYDAYGLVAFDAMSRGIPVIVSENTAAGSDGVRDGVDGYVVPIRNVETLKERILRLFNQPELAMEMGKNARDRVLEFDGNQYRKNLGRIMGEISHAAKSISHHTNI